MSEQEQGVEALADVPVEIVMGAKLTHGDITLEIEDLNPKTFKERRKLALDIIDYNRRCRADSKKRGIEFGDKDTPYHWWQINWRKVVRG